MRRPSRSSNQSKVLALISAADKWKFLRLHSFRNYDFVAADFYRELFERLGRRSGDHPAFEVVGAVVAGAPHFAARFLILHGAVEVRADGGESLPLGVVDAHQEHRFIAELDDLAGVRLEVLRFAGIHFVDGNLGNLRRVKEARHRGEERRERGGGTAPEEA